MGYALDPAQTHDFFLLSDKAKPESERPAFIFHFPTHREFKRLCALMDESYADTTNGEVAYAKAMEGAKVVLVGWRNVIDRKTGKPLPFNPDDLEAAMSSMDVLELRERLPTELTLTELDKKKSLLPSLSNTAESANGMPPAASAAIAPANATNKETPPNP